MKKSLFILSLLVVTFMIAESGAWGQSDEFTLEEIIVTSEKREVNLQQIPSSVVAMTGVTLMEQGKITVEQILENIPNVRYGEGLESNPGGAIAIRGVQYKRNSDGQPPSATATYVDGVFQGIGGNYDINRVEILRGPQGTLYGRSATGGVVAFHTNNPMLSEFSASLSAETGTANLRNAQAAINVPLGEIFAARAAARFYERDGYFNPDGAYRQSKDGRIKLLYQPSDALDVILSASVSNTIENSGGITARLTSPTEINYNASVAPVSEGGAIESTQTSLSVNYDFEGSTLSYIGAFRTYEDMKSPGFVMNPPGMIMVALRTNPGENFHTHEIRLTSDTDESWTWLIGANYFNSDYERYEVSRQIWTESNLDPATVNADMFEMEVKGEITNYGIFTEETFEMRDDLRVTAGLRYDKTSVDSYTAFNMNLNQDALGNVLKPENWDSFGITGDVDYDNITYKLRLEYDVTPKNMLYLTTATGFLPGDIKLGVQVMPSNPPTAAYTRLPLDEEKLISYEIGSKNRFLDDRMQVNLSAFYYDYENYRHMVNTAQRGQAPNFIIITTPLRMTGAELSADWLVTMEDKVSLTAGLLNAKITEYPILPVFGDARQWMMLEDIPNLPDLTVNLNYEHTFLFANGSTLVPRAELNYTSGMYLTQLTQLQVDNGNLPWAHQDSRVIANMSATWYSPNGMFSATAYMRNAFDEEYKAGVTLNNNGATDRINVAPGDPRTLGVMFSVKFR